MSSNNRIKLYVVYSIGIVHIIPKEFSNILTGRINVTSMCIPTKDTHYKDRAYFRLY